MSVLLPYVRFDRRASKDTLFFFPYPQDWVISLDFDRKQVYVRRGKYGRSRYSLLGDKAAQLLRTYMNVYRPHSFLFYNPKDSTIRISNGAIQKALRKLLIE